MNNDDIIRAKDQNNCIICGTKSNQLYDKLTDIEFNTVKGEWRLCQCENQNCTLTWLNPMPLAEDIGKAYKNYYTHIDIAVNRHSCIVNCYENIRRGYLAYRYGYQDNNVNFFHKLLSNVLYFFPIRKEGLDYPFNILKGLAKGNLLEIGCGAGNHLSLLKNWGWDTKGLDFDKEAVKTATKKKLDVVCGDLLSQNYLDDQFDVILMHHVIEHLPNPIEVIQECNRILKTNGYLIMITPNVGSLGRKLYGRSWRGLETPRHLYLYNKNSLKQLLSLSLFQSINVKTLPFRSMYILNKSPKYKYQLKGVVFLYRIYNSLLFSIEILTDKLFGLCLAEEIMVVAKK